MSSFQKKTVKVTGSTLELIHNMLTPTITHPSEVVSIAHAIKDADPTDENKFIDRQVQAFEDYQAMISGKEELMSATETEYQINVYVNVFTTVKQTMKTMHIVPHLMKSKN